MVSPVDEVGYYAAKAPSPISNRDFCTHRTFRVFDDKYVIFNKSVETDKCPEDPNFVRGWSFRTGYQMKEHKEGCTLEYMTQSDPRGWIPKWVTNSVTGTLAPKIVEKMIKVGCTCVFAVLLVGLTLNCRRLPRIPSGWRRTPRASPSTLMSTRRCTSFEAENGW